MRTAILVGSLIMAYAINPELEWDGVVLKFIGIVFIGCVLFDILHPGRD